MKTATPFTAHVILAFTAVVTLSLATPQGWAQQKNTLTFQTPAQNTQYTQQLTLDVGDIPGHQLRTYEIHRTYPKDPPVFAGVPVKDSWVRGGSDWVSGNGGVLSYYVFNLENGDKIFGKLEATAQAAGGKSEGRRNVVGNLLLTGGTGKFRGIRGVLHYTTIVDPAKGYNESKTEGEYWFDKD
ncbi:hypothetical protein ACV229_24455 [Burkholderia sp. MR1-5-21]